MSLCSLLDHQRHPLVGGVSILKFKVPYCLYCLILNEIKVDYRRGTGGRKSAQIIRSADNRKRRVNQILDFLTHARQKNLDKMRELLGHVIDLKRHVIDLKRI